MTKTLNIMAIALFVGAVLTAGCDEMVFNQNGGAPGDEKTQPETLPQSGHLNKETLADDENTDTQGATHVAYKWANKYAEIAKELVVANQRISELDGEKKKLQTQVARMKADIANYRLEINDANTMLQDMKKDLKQWRENVLGYRKEMMASQTALLASQQKILVLLGAEVPNPEVQASMAAPPSKKIAKP